MNFIVFVLFLKIIVSCSPKLVKELRKYENDKLSLIEQYNIYGNVVERKYIKDGFIALKEEYVVIDNKIYKAIFSDRNDKIITIDYSYENDKLARARYISDNKVQILIIYRYDEADRLYSESYFDIIQGLRKTTFYHYDLNNKCVAKINISQGDSLFKQHFFQYDNSNLIREITLYGGDTIRLVNYQYKKDLLTDKFIFDNRLLSLHLSYVYNIHRKPKKILHIEQGVIVREEKISYNVYGYEKKRKIIDYRVFDKPEKKQIDIIKYKYQYF